LDLKVFYNQLNFFINKQQGVFYAPEVLDGFVDRSQQSLYDDYYPQYGTSERMRDALAPFKTKKLITLADNPGGFILYPDDIPNGLMGLQDILDFEGIVTDSSGLTHPVKCPFLNEDERTDRINSQVIPLSPSFPFVETMDDGFQLYPKQPQVGTLTYLRRPKPPFFKYTLVSGRVVVYDQAGSTQLEWFDKDQNSIIIKALEMAGVNISEADILQYAETKDQQNINSKDHV
jgi:hypothetical protein